MSYPASLHEMQEALIAATVASAPNLTAAARILGIARSTVYRHLHPGHLKPPQPERPRARTLRKSEVRAVGCGVTCRDQLLCIICGYCRKHCGYPEHWRGIDWSGYHAGACFPAAA